MVTLLILSLLVIIAVSFLSSMSAEHQTADAYAASASAEQATRAAVDSATAMLAESFRDFPDSATVWDNEQSPNTGTPTNTAIVSSPYNEGTSLYLHAMPATSDASEADPLPPHVTYANGGTSYVASNDANGNDPNNPACQTFVLPLISGVVNGRARLVSQKSSLFQAPMNLGESDPTKQNWTDLNVRRAGGDLQGAIGSPPGWTGTPAGGSGSGPQAARAYWINVTGNDGLIHSRYAFWVEDESFRLNTSVAGGPTSTSPSATPPTQPPDNTAQPTDSSGKPRSLQPSDLTLVGTLAAAGDTSSTDASTIMATRAGYPGYFFPDPLAFSHAFDGTTGQTPLIDTVRYVTTNQSSALNLSRHGSQRLNLNSTVSTPASTSTAAQIKTAIQSQVNQLVQTLEYHLPYFGERFYRTTTNTAGLNDATQVQGSPMIVRATGADGTPVTDAPSSPYGGTSSQIYYYKIAANLRDYVDTDCQPTMLGTGGVAMVGPTTFLGDTAGTGATPNEIWAQGKECTPYIQEVAVRYRPVVTTAANATATNPKGHYKLSVDYYIEFWNMSDRDISASQMSSPTIWVRDQQQWATYTTSYLLEPDTYPPNGEALSSSHPPSDTQIDLTGNPTNPVKDGNGVTQSNGVVFRAGTVTVITTDPDCATYTYKELTGSGGKTNLPAAGLPDLTKVFICPIVPGSGSRIYSGKITTTDGNPTTNGGLELGGDFRYTSPYTGTEVSLVNGNGYFDLVRGAITKTGSIGYNVYTNTDKFPTEQGYVNDFSFGSSIMGNVADNAGSAAGPAPASSQLGDARTNNEQLMVSVANAAADGTRFMPSSRTLGSPNYPSLQPDVTTAGQGWPDYYKLPPASGGNPHPSPDCTTAPAVIAGTMTADGPITSIGQLGDIFDPARVPGPNILYSHGGGRTLKIGQHDDLYSDDPTANVPATSGNVTITTMDSVPASSGWAAWRLTDIFDIADPILLPGRININGIMRDNGAALRSALQKFSFQPKTASGTSDPTIHGDGSSSGVAGASLDTDMTSSKGFSQIVAQIKQRLDASVAARVKPFFERGEFGELGYNSSNVASNSPLFGTNSTNTSNALLGVDMNQVTDHSREELFRRLAQMTCTRGNTFTVYAVGQSIVQTSITGSLKITGTQRMRVTFRLMPKTRVGNAYADFHPAYNAATDGTISSVNSIDPAHPTNALTGGQIGVVPRFAKPDRYDVQILQATAY